jgi:uncharacterized protein with PhoU and TrkA domain
MMDEEPATVRELLSEMKDSSELSVYLAYSALMFRDPRIAEEVSELEDRMEELRSRFWMAAMLAVRNMEDARSVSPLLRIASAANGISKAAGEIAELLQRGIEIHPLIFEALENAEEKVSRCWVSEESSLAGIALGEADLESTTGMSVIAIRRPAGRWIWAPGDETRIEKGDVLIARGPRDGATILKQIAKGEREPARTGG